MTPTDNICHPKPQKSIGEWAKENAAEWVFIDWAILPDNEVPPCHFWELAREAFRRRPYLVRPVIALEKWRAKCQRQRRRNAARDETMPDGRTDARSVALREKIRVSMGQYSSLFSSDLLEIPWLSLDLKERQFFMEVLLLEWQAETSLWEPPAARVQIYANEGFTHFRERQHAVADFGGWENKKLDVGFFALHWGHGKDAVTREVKAWLERRWRELGEPEPHRSQTGKTPKRMAHLEALALVRMSNAGFRALEICTFLSERETFDRVWREQMVYDACAGRLERYLKALFPSEKSRR